MGFEFRAVRFRVETESGPAGYEERFGPGMTIVRGGNTIGKSLLLQGLLYGVGFESLFASRKGVLTRAMTLQIDLPDGKHRVLRSWIEVVIANSAGDVLTIHRVVRSESGDTKATDLVRTWDSDVFDQEDRPASVDYLVGRPGVATEERGFYRFLAGLLGWEQPKVPTYEGKAVPLYLQVVFGLTYVDQKRGWGGTVPQVPTSYQIVEPLRKAVEFALGLDVIAHAQQRQILTERQRALVAREQNIRGRLDGVSRVHGGRVKFADIAVESWVNAVPAPVVEVLTGETWTELSDRMDRLREARSVTARKVLAGAETRPDTAQLEADLAAAERDLSDLSGLLEALNQDEHMLHMQLGALARRINTLDDEYDRYRQLDALQQLGSIIAPHTMEDGDCPTCHQSLEAVESIEGSGLPVAETREAIRQDRATVKSLVAEAEKRSELIAVRRAAWTEQASSARLRIRAVKTDLVAVEGTPSSSEIQEVIERDQELARLANLQAQFLQDADEWSGVATNLQSVRAEIASLGTDTQTDHDRDRIAAWLQRLRVQLSEYGFESADPSDIEFDQAMKPVVDSYDIGFQGSASDGIRLRWAYLLSLMETCAAIQGSHPGFLMLDEPGQQGVEETSLSALYRHLVGTSLSAGQVFVTTSEPPAKIQAWMGDAPFEMVDLGQMPLLKRLSR